MLHKKKIGRAPRYFLGLTLAGCLALSAVALSASAGPFAGLNPKAISIRLPADLHWQGGPDGPQTVTVVGDPSKPGLYVILVKWTAHHNSHPHFHPNDRYVTVLSGTWWVNTGSNYDPDHMKPVPAGSFVTHFAHQVHYDGAKDADTVIEIVGMGPETATPAEAK